ncbi:MAG: uroporphyrinogen-III synthase [Legionella sp.]|nr:uroporphyrinogen-III synthase [Legionella sp.]
MHKKLMLKNLRVLNTRPEHLAKITSNQITKAGGTSIAFPLLNIEASEPHWIHKLPALNTIQHAIFISPNAVTYFFKHIASNSWPNTIQIYAQGHGTKLALEAQHIFNAMLPEKSDSEHLLKLKALQTVSDQTILLIKGNEGRTLIQETLIKRHANLIPIEVYQRTLPTLNLVHAKSLWYEDAVDIILITSETALKHLFVLFDFDFDNKAAAWLRSKPCWVISERLAKAAKKQGFTHIIIHPFI